MLSIGPMELSNPITWNLPPSKSHMIRWLAMASQSKKETTIKFYGEPGNDIKSMKECMESFGVEVSETNNIWKIRGIDFEANNIKNRKLYCGNSGTTTNFVITMVASFETEFVIDGDDSLRSRDFSEINNALRSMGATITSNKLPFTVKGPVEFDRVVVNAGKSSQPLSSLIMGFQKKYKDFKIGYVGESVSRDYSKLTFDIAKKCGIEIEEANDEIIVNCEKLTVPKIVEIPQEISLLPISILLSELHDVEFINDRLEKSFFLNDSIEMIKDKNNNLLDLRDCSDFITPAAVILAIRKGGKIIGAAHAKGKESDRIEKTAELLEVFGMECKIEEDGLVIKGNQTPKRPKKPVKTYLDHRIAMTAIALATYTGGEINNPEITKITDPMFIEKILRLSDN